jgi:hypothetical protein
MSSGIRKLHSASSLLLFHTIQFWTHSSLPGWGTMLPAGRSRIWFPMRSLNISMYVILPAALGLLSWLSLQQKWVPWIFLRVKVDWFVRLTTSSSSVSRFSGKCGVLYVWNVHTPLRPVTRIAILTFKSQFWPLSLLCWPLWSSGQNSWLQIRRPGFDSRHYQKKK